MTVTQRYQPVNLVIPALTLPSAPFTQTLDLGDCLLRRIDLRIPPGPSGLAGVYITQTGTQIWPWGVIGTYLIGDDEQFSTPIGTEIDQGIEFVAFNTDTFDHTFYFKFLYTPISLVAQGSTSPQIVAIS